MPRPCPKAYQLPPDDEVRPPSFSAGVSLRLTATSAPAPDPSQRQLQPPLPVAKEERHCDRHGRRLQRAVTGQFQAALWCSVRRRAASRQVSIQAACVRGDGGPPTRPASLISTPYLACRSIQFTRCRTALDHYRRGVYIASRKPVTHEPNSAVMSLAIGGAMGGFVCHARCGFWACRPVCLLSLDSRVAEHTKLQVS